MSTLQAIFVGSLNTVKEKFGSWPTIICDWFLDPFVSYTSLIFLHNQLILLHFSVNHGMSNNSKTSSNKLCSGYTSMEY